VLHRFREFPKGTVRLLRNKTFLFESLGVSVESFMVGGLTVFWPKYAETQFEIDPSDAGIYFGE